MMENYNTKTYRLWKCLLWTFTWVPLVLLIMFWDKIPRKIPQHYDWDGTITDYADKGIILFLLFMNIFDFALTLIINYIIPNLSTAEHGYGKRLIDKVTEDDMNFLNRISQVMVNMMMSLIALSFDIIAVCMISVKEIGVIAVIACIGACVIPIVWYFVLYFGRKKAIEQRPERRELSISEE